MRTGGSGNGASLLWRRLDSPARAGARYTAALRGALITDLAEAARPAGFAARVTVLSPDSLVTLLETGAPPIVLYQKGRGPLTAGHYGVVTGWDAERRSFTLHDGGSRPREIEREALAKRWRTAGSQALVIEAPR